MKIKKLIIPISIAPLVTPIITSCNTHPNLQIATTNTDISYPNQVNVVKVVGKLNKTQEIHLISSHDDIVTSSFD
jgi:hypothetical protein